MRAKCSPSARQRCRSHREMAGSAYRDSRISTTQRSQRTPPGKLEQTLLGAQLVTLDECRSLLASAQDLGVPCESTHRAEEFEVFLGIENIARGTGFSEYREGIAYLAALQNQAATPFPFPHPEAPLMLRIVS